MRSGEKNKGSVGKGGEGKKRGKERREGCWDEECEMKKNRVRRNLRK